MAMCRLQTIFSPRTSLMSSTSSVMADFHTTYSWEQSNSTQNQAKAHVMPATPWCCHPLASHNPKSVFLYRTAKCQTFQETLYKTSKLDARSMPSRQVAPNRAPNQVPKKVPKKVFSQYPCLIKSSSQLELATFYPTERLKRLILHRLVRLKMQRSVSLIWIKRR